MLDYCDITQYLRRNTPSSFLISWFCDWIDSDMTFTSYSERM